IPAIVAAARMAAAGVGRGGAGVEVDADAVHVVGCACSSHACHVAVVGPGVGAVVETGWGRRAADDHHVGIGVLDGVVGRAQDVVDVSSGVNLARGPFAVDVLLVPDFDGIGAVGSHAADKGRVGVEVKGARAGIEVGAGNAEQNL